MFFTDRLVHKLAKEQGGRRISIYLPTHRRGPDIEQDPIRLKNLIANARNRALEAGLEKREIQPILAPAEELMDDRDFWRHQDDGLALFLADGQIQTYHLSTMVPEFVYVGNRFSVRPLLSSTVSSGRFYVLALSQNRVCLLECTHSDANEVNLPNVPASLPDALGHDWEQKSLQFHTGAARVRGHQRAGQFHGQGSGSDTAGAEIEEFFREIDRGVARVLDSPTAPVVLACVEYLAPMFRSVCKHLNVFDEVVAGNPDHLSTHELHAAALQLIWAHLNAEKAKLCEDIAQSPGPEKIRIGIAGVLAALRESRVAGIVTATDHPIWGRFQDSNGRIEIHDHRQPGDDDLLDLAITRALSTGASVYGIERESVPGDDAVVAALLRY